MAEKRTGLRDPVRGTREYSRHACDTQRAVSSAFRVWFLVQRCTPALCLPIPIASNFRVGTNKRSPLSVTRCIQGLKMSAIGANRRFKRTVKTAGGLLKQTLCGRDAAEEPTGIVFTARLLCNRLCRLLRTRAEFTSSSALRTDCRWPGHLASGL